MPSEPYFCHPNPDMFEILVEQWQRGTPLTREDARELMVLFRDRLQMYRDLGDRIQLDRLLKLRERILDDPRCLRRPAARSRSATVARRFPRILPGN